MAVGPGAHDAEGSGASGPRNFALEGGAHRLNHLRGPASETGDGALFDLAVLAPTFAQQDDRERVTVGDAVNIQGNK